MYTSEYDLGLGVDYFRRDTPLGNRSRRRGGDRIHARNDTKENNTQSPGEAVCMGTGGRIYLADVRDRKNVVSSVSVRSSSTESEGGFVGRL